MFPIQNHGNAQNHKDFPRYLDAFSPHDAPDIRTVNPGIGAQLVNCLSRLLQDAPKRLRDRSIRSFMGTRRGRKPPLK